MINISYVEGNAALPNMNESVIAHVCNDYGGWGRGFVVSLTNLYPEVEQKYREWYNSREKILKGIELGKLPAYSAFALGNVQFVPVTDSLSVANMVAQHGNSTPECPAVDYEALDLCLERLALWAIAQKRSVHMPRIGCGLGGGKWSAVEPLIIQNLSAADVPVFVYDLPKGHDLSRSKIDA